MLLLDFLKIGVIICVAWQRSSVVEQRNHNPLVGGPNPSAATRISRCSGIFLFCKNFSILSVLADVFIKTPPGITHKIFNFAGPDVWAVGIIVFSYVKMQFYMLLFLFDPDRVFPPCQ